MLLINSSITMVSKSVVFFGLLLVALAKVGHQSELNNFPKDNKVAFQLYYESMCPYCHKYILNTLAPVLRTKDIYKAATFKLVPYGNAKSEKIGNQIQIRCQHRQKECEGNILHECALSLYDFPQAFDYIECLQNSDKHWAKDGKLCADSLKLNWTDLKDCTNSYEGHQKQYLSGLLTKANQVRGVPFVRINGKHNTQTKERLLQVICDNYRGPEKIAACMTDSK